VAKAEQVALIRRGVAGWNAWRESYPNVQPDLSRADLRGVDINGANLQAADLRESDLTNASLLSANLMHADLRWSLLVQANLNNARCCFSQLDESGVFEATMVSTDLRSASLCNANLSRTEMSGAVLTEANMQGAAMRSCVLRFAKLQKARLCQAQLSKADLSGADLTQADLSGANLEATVMVGTCLRGALMTGARVFGASVWNVEIESASTQDLIISSEDQATVTVDRLEIAQFIYLLLNNKKIRDVIDSVTSKLVLILGRFLPERKSILDRVRQELRSRGYVPVLFDFPPPTSRDLTETISTLAHLAKFVIADITSAKSVPQELMRIVPNLPSVPIQPILLACEKEYGMFETFKHYPWVLETFLYENEQHLSEKFESSILEPAEHASNRASR
jgi:uncharacterized protein YjbI with pentapeptide repeats